MTARRAKVAAADVVALLGCLHECENPSGGPEFDPAVVKRAIDQVRALLAVARAAERLEPVAYFKDMDRAGMTRALARLRRASGGEGK